ncbi:hypothetical protein JW979_09040 [bacterium]|nr:hypothetical protein [candidate division CSSED10-310 bacterium]
MIKIAFAVSLTNDDFNAVSRFCTCPIICISHIGYILEMGGFFRTIAVIWNYASSNCLTQHDIAVMTASAAAHIPIIMIVSDNSPARESMIRMHGVFHYLIRPYESDDLSCVLHQAESFALLYQTLDDSTDNENIAVKIHSP